MYVYIYMCIVETTLELALEIIAFYVQDKCVVKFI